MTFENLGSLRIDQDILTDMGKRGMAKEDGHLTNFGRWMATFSKETNNFDITFQKEAFDNKVRQARATVDKLYDAAKIPDNYTFGIQNVFGQTYEADHFAALDNKQLEELGISDAGILKCMNDARSTAIDMLGNNTTKLSSDNKTVLDRFEQGVVIDYVKDMAATAAVLYTDFQQFRKDGIPLDRFDKSNLVNLGMTSRLVNAAKNDYPLNSALLAADKCPSDLIEPSAKLTAYGWASNTWIDERTQALLESNEEFMDIYVLSANGNTLVNTAKNFRPPFYKMMDGVDKGNVDPIDLQHSIGQNYDQGARDFFRTLPQYLLELQKLRSLEVAFP